MRSEETLEPRIGALGTSGTDHFIRVTARSVCPRRRVSPGTQQIWFWKSDWGITGQPVDLEPTEDAIAFENECAGEVCLRPEHEVAEDMHTGRSFRHSLHLEVEARAAARPATKASRVLAALLRIGRSIKRQSGSHRTLRRDGWPDFVFAFHDTEEIGPRMLARIAKQTGLTPGHL
jgi:predicted RNA binding protein YcfA (HicA-like mRNA interferase family)